jgi:hypothetical protein
MHTMERTWISVLWASLRGSVPGFANIGDITTTKRVEEALAERVRLAALAADIGTALSGEGTLREGLQRCTEALGQHLNAAFARIWTLNERTQPLELEASAGIYARTLAARGSSPLPRANSCSSLGGYCTLRRA